MKDTKKPAKELAGMASMDSMLLVSLGFVLDVTSSNAMFIRFYLLSRGDRRLDAFVLSDPPPQHEPG
ncbi:hypothetical protein HU200_001175 [Digitaria exilis]|uniref:Uncharacterized protein n=1 Tax=Digitaria exilis TaxID=1010633 RepID=A0A835FYW1_9POAL|nr:hypothetical protein HU200_001175 [Digitaria exilis]